MWRVYQRNKVALIGMIFAGIFLLPFALGIAISTIFGYRLLDPPFNEHLLRAILLGIYLFWVFSPLMGYALNESYDITKLFLYPISTRQLFAGAILGSLVDFPVLLALPALAAVFIGFVSNPFNVLLIAIPVLLFLFHTVSLSQTLLLVGAGFLRSRRYRDIMIVLAPLMAALFYLAFQIIPRQAVLLNYRMIVESRTWDIVSYLPPGLAARAVGAASRGEYLTSIAFLALLAVVSAATVYLAGWLLEKICTGAVVSEPARARKREATRNGAPVGLLQQLHLPSVISAVIEKEVKYYTRDPYFKSVLVNLLYMLVIWIIVVIHPFSNDGISLRITPSSLWSLVSIMLLMQMQFTGNIFGIEGSAAATLFMLPGSRRQIIIGKNLILFLSLLVVNGLIVGMLCWVGKMLPMLLPVLTWTILATVMFIAVGNLTSIWFPLRTVVRGWRMQQQSAGEGCARSYIYIGIMLVILLLLLPAFAALIVPMYLVPRIWLALTIPLALAYVIGCYLYSLRLAEPLLLRREIEIVEKLTPQE